MKKLSAKLLVIVTLLGLVGLFSNTVAQAATPEVLTVNITDLTKEQRFNQVSLLLQKKENVLY